MNNYYVYIHRRKSDNLPFYVGKGKGNRAWEITGKSRNKYWHKVNAKHGLIVEIVFDNLSEEEAFQCEKDTILEFEYFGYPLTNMSKGGEGNSGLIFTDQQRLNITNGLRNKRYSDNLKTQKVIKRTKAYGMNNHFADKNIYSFVRLIDGLEVTCSRHDLCEKYNLDKTLLKKLFYMKNPRKSAEGWRLKDAK